MHFVAAVSELKEHFCEKGERCVISMETGLLGEPEGSESGGEAVTAAAGTCKTKPAALFLPPLCFFLSKPDFYFVKTQIPYFASFFFPVSPAGVYSVSVWLWLVLTTDLVLSCIS